MGLYIVGKDGKFDHWEWEGSVRGLVAAVGDGDARLGFVVDKKSGASISMNISDDFGGEATEPFYVLTADRENMYDAYNRREAIKLLSNIRKSVKYPELELTASGRSKAKKGRKSKRATAQSVVRGLR